MNMVLSTARSTAFHIRQSIPDSATFSSNKNLPHNLNFQHTMQTKHCSQFLHTRQTIPATLNSNYIAYEVSFIPTKCFIRKKLTFRLLFCSLHQSIHSIHKTLLRCLGTGLVLRPRAAARRLRHHVSLMTLLPRARVTNYYQYLSER